MRGQRTLIVVLVIVALGGAVAVSALYAFSVSMSTTTSPPPSSSVSSTTSSVSSSTPITSSNSSSIAVNLPPGCTKPANGFLIIVGDSPGNVGFNDSFGHGAPANPWPIMTVTQGSAVNITVCNTDVQTHSFNIIHYVPLPAKTVQPGQVLHLSFVANATGSFQVYCGVFCSIHVYMQSGQLRVMPA